jgi:hypothetical protein
VDSGNFSFGKAGDEAVQEEEYQSFSDIDDENFGANVDEQVLISSGIVNMSLNKFVCKRVNFGNHYDEDTVENNSKSQCEIC